MCLCPSCSLARCRKGTCPRVLRVSGGFVVGSPDFAVYFPTSCSPPGSCASCFLVPSTRPKEPELSIHCTLNKAHVPTKSPAMAGCGRSFQKQLGLLCLGVEILGRAAKRWAAGAPPWCLRLGLRETRLFSQQFLSHPCPPPPSCLISACVSGQSLTSRDASCHPREAHSSSPTCRCLDPPHAPGAGDGLRGQQRGLLSWNMGMTRERVDCESSVDGVACIGTHDTQMRRETERPWPVCLRGVCVFCGAQQLCVEHWE